MRINISSLALLSATSLFAVLPHSPFFFFFFKKYISCLPIGGFEDFRFFCYLLFAALGTHLIRSIVSGKKASWLDILPLSSLSSCLRPHAYPVYPPDSCTATYPCILVHLLSDSAFSCFQKRQ